MEKAIDKQLTRIIYSLERKKLAEFLSNPNIGSGIKLVLRNLLDRRIDKSYSFPGEVTIARDVGLGVDAVKKYVKFLKERDYVKIKRGGINPHTGKPYSSNTYDLSYFLTLKTVPVKSKEVNQDETEE